MNYLHKRGLAKISGVARSCGFSVEVEGETVLLTALTAKQQEDSLKEALKEARAAAEKARVAELEQKPNAETSDPELTPDEQESAEPAKKVQETEKKADKPKPQPTNKPKK